MTIARDAARVAKQLNRKLYNTGQKIIKAGLRHRELVELGKTVIVTEKDGVKSYVLPPTPSIVEPPTPPRLSWLGGKQYAQQGDSRKNRSHHGPEHREAFTENASRILSKEIDKALTPEVLVDPTTNEPKVTDVHIGEFADHDKAQGDAIDHSIATGDPLFATKIPDVTEAQ